MYGLLGEKLSHSFSPQIHSMLGDYEYNLFEVKRENLNEFIKNGSWNAINVTIPYKKEIIPYLDEISDNAKKIGSVNTVVRKKDGKLFGDNTDFDGFLYLVNKSKVNFEGKKVIVLGTGGASLAVLAVVKHLNAGEIINVSRTGENNYNNIQNHKDSDIIINTTPVGMYPENLVSPVKLKIFTHLSAVFDIIYNPQKTKLILDAESLDIPAFSGLYMLVAQAKRASEIFFSKHINDTITDEIYERLSLQMRNIVLIGMPGCGKSTIGSFLAQKLSRELIDTDKIIEETSGMKIPDIFSKYGEPYFRDLETQAIMNACKLSGKIIATGGGAVTINENYNSIRQNSVVIFINRNIEVLPKDGRPLSQRHSLIDIYNKRLPLYRNFCDFEIDGNLSIKEVSQNITEVLGL